MKNHFSTQQSINSLANLWNVSSQNQSLVVENHNPVSDKRVCADENLTHTNLIGIKSDAGTKFFSHGEMREGLDFIWRCTFCFEEYIYDTWYCDECGNTEFEKEAIS